jgi:small-conductance mechanosensitive channel
MVQVGLFEGTVQDIGIRASTIRTWSGAEVVVPNAALTSTEVVNWTLRDRDRRVEIPIGVAYGSDPERVIEVLIGVATGHAEVSDRPEPHVLFQGFGDSSLDFELRAWTHADRFLGVRSELRVGITKALAEAGIEIPFPQRDLHVRSVDPGALRALRDEPER